MKSKFIITGILAAMIYFLFGIIIYMAFLENIINDLGGGAIGVLRTDIVWWALILGSLGYGFAFTYVLFFWVGVSTYIRGIRLSIIITLFFELGYDLSWYSGSNLMNFKGLIVKVIITTFISAIAGSAIGWWLDKSSHSKINLLIM